MGHFMKTILSQALLIASLLLVPFSAHSRAPVPIVDYPNSSITTRPGSTLTVDQVKNAITAAAQSRNWQISPGPASESLQAVLHVRGKHTVVVDITYTTQSYSISYQTSTNMKYSITPDTNVRVIHPFYNRWVSDLRESIRLELNRL